MIEKDEEQKKNQPTEEKDTLTPEQQREKDASFFVYVVGLDKAQVATGTTSRPC